MNKAAIDAAAKSEQGSRIFKKLFEGFSIHRWCDMARVNDIVEMDKAAEKMILSFLIGKSEEHGGNFVDWEWMVYASLFDLLEKIALNDIKAPVQAIFAEKYRDEYLKLNDWMLGTYKRLLDKALFSRFTIYIGQKTGTYGIDKKSVLASRIYKAAGKIASLRELKSIECVNDPLRCNEISASIVAGIQPFMDMECVQKLLTHQPPYGFLLVAEGLRKQVRWNGTVREPKTTVMGHSFFVALATILLQKMYKKRVCTGRLVNTYFCALFHDLCECVTRDIISPVKYATPELPQVLSKIEQEIVERELFPLLSPFLQEGLRYYIDGEFLNKVLIDGVLHEATFDELCTKYNKDEFCGVDGQTIRIADHMSALMEADASIKCGITSEHLRNGISQLLLQYPPSRKVNSITVRPLFDNVIA